MISMHDSLISCELNLMPTQQRTLLLQFAMTKKPDFVHLNLSEARSFSRETSPFLISKDICNSGVAAAITAGKDGLYLSDLGQTIHANVQLSAIKSAVGSGDCLLAGLVAAKNRRLNLVDTAKLAVACGAANCLREDLGMLYKKDVEDLFKQVNISSEQVVKEANQRT
jgi:tagatose 6-phosphate kinase